MFREIQSTLNSLFYCLLSLTTHIDFKSRFWDILMDLFDAPVWPINEHVDVDESLLLIVCCILYVGVVVRHEKC